MSLFSDLETMNKQLNNEYNEAISTEINKIKYLKSFDEVIGLSNLNEKDIIGYLKTNNLSNMIIISDPEQKIKSSFGFKSNFECQIENQQIVSRNDENEFKTKVINLVFFSLISISGLFLLYKRSVAFFKYSKANSELRNYIWKIIELRVNK